MNRFTQGLIFGIILIFFLIEIRNKCFIKNSAKNKTNEIIQKLARQSARWAVAAENDMSPVIKVLHANYAAGYLWALLDIASSEEIKTATGIDTIKFSKKITDVQDRATQSLVMVCPKYSGGLDKYLTKISGEG